MHDAVQIEQLGTPATLMITEPFQSLAASFAVTLGMAGYHNVMVPHPIANRDKEGLRRLAAQVAGSVADQLTRP